jgi:non-ribosomal peptide synthase protein (TIGR01720 family)
MLRSEKSFDVPNLKAALTEVVKHHDALRNIYDGQRQVTLTTEESNLFDWYEYDYTNGETATEELAKTIERASNKIQSSINLTKGPLVKAGLFHTNSGDHLLVCVHHLVIDGVSWRIFLEDLFNGYKQAAEAKELLSSSKLPQQSSKITLPRKMASYKEWAEALLHYAESEALLEESEYWEKVAIKSELSGAFTSNGTARGIYRTQAIQVDPETTQKLLLEAGKTYGTEINDLLLASLMLAANHWKNRQYIIIEMEGHGREPIDREIAIDRTIGWFTSMYPVVLELRPTVEETIIATKETLRGIPNHGLGYGVLKYLGNQENLETKTDITFNYLGSLDNELAGYEGISISEMPSGQNISEKNLAGTELMLNGSISNGQLRFSLTYDTGLCEDKEAQAFALAYENAVKEVVETCLSKDGVVKTPSDFGIGISLEALQDVEELLAG